MMLARITALAEESFGERVAYAGKITLEGLLRVFAVLALIWGMLELLRFFAYELPKKRKAADAAKAEAAPVPEPAADNADNADDGAIVAAVTAAVTLVLAEEAAKGGRTPGGFRVVSFKRTETVARWDASK